MSLETVSNALPRQNKQTQLRSAILSSFTRSASSNVAGLKGFSHRDWIRVKPWLDSSGLSLYFLDHLKTLGIRECIPETLREELHENLSGNRERVAWFHQESAAISQSLDSLGVPLAFLKGITLPEVCAIRRELRDQADIDILIRGQDADRVKVALEGLGYRLDAVSGSTWEFRAGRIEKFSLKKKYDIPTERAVEVHLQSSGNGSLDPDRLGRTELRHIQDVKIQSLCSVDIFVQQGQHIFKHLCGEFTRAAWILEFWRHACARRDDIVFWRNVERAANAEDGAPIAIGAASMLAALVFGEFAPESLANWSIDRIPDSIRMWIQLYGPRALFADPPGSKFYLLLRRELPSYAQRDKVEHRRLLFPFHAPRRLLVAQQNESLAERLRRYKIESQYWAFRLRFHITEGMRLAVATPQWERIAGITR